MPHAKRRRDGAPKFLPRLIRCLHWLLLLLLVLDLGVLPLHAGIHGPAELVGGGHGWHVGQEALHIETADGHVEAHDLAVLRSATSIRLVGSGPAEESRGGGNDPRPPGVVAWALCFLLAAAAALQPAHVLRRRRASAAGPLRAWQGLCPPGQAPPRR
ncbi:MAG: hypothetical protein L6Q75_03045 [Burkholderiaceae bacterium]|nr:hypothetical protein [Burkholderiaceae bacterium]